MPNEIRAKFAKTDDVEFDVDKAYKESQVKGERPKVVLERSLAQHSVMCIENSEDVMDARQLANLLSDQIAYRIRLYSYSICKSTDNYLKWLQEDYERKLLQSFNNLQINNADVNN